MDVKYSIKKLREDNELTQEEFGKVAGVSAMAVSQWENGRAVPRMGAIQRLSDHFNVPKSAIMGDHYEYAFMTVDSSADLVPVDEIQSLIGLYGSMSDEGREHLMAMARSLAQTYQRA